MVANFAGSIRVAMFLAYSGRWAPGELVEASRASTSNHRNRSLRIMGSPSRLPAETWGGGGAFGMIVIADVDGKRVCALEEAPGSGGSNYHEEDVPLTKAFFAKYPKSLQKLGTTCNKAIKHTFDETDAHHYPHAVPAVTREQRARKRGELKKTSLAARKW